MTYMWPVMPKWALSELLDKNDKNGNEESTALYGWIISKLQF